MISPLFLRALGGTRQLPASPDLTGYHNPDLVPNEPVGNTNFRMRRDPGLSAQRKAARVTTSTRRDYSAKWVVSEQRTNRESPCQAATPCTSGVAGRSKNRRTGLRELVSCA